MRWVVVLLILSSCTAYNNRILRKYCITKDTVTTFSSDTTTLRKVDSLYKRGDTVYLPFRVLVSNPCDSNWKPKFKPAIYHTRTKHLEATATVDTLGNILVNCKEDSLLEVTNKMVITINSLQKQIITKEKVPIYNLYQKFLLKVGAFLFPFILVLLIFMFIRYGVTRKHII